MIKIVCHAHCHAITFHEDLGPRVGWWENFLCLSSPQETKQLIDPRMSWDRTVK